MKPHIFTACRDTEQDVNFGWLVGFLETAVPVNPNEKSVCVLEYACNVAVCAQTE